MCEYIILQVLQLGELAEGVQVAGATREVQSRASIVVSAIYLGAQRQHALYIGPSALSSDEHERGYIAVHYRLVDREELLEDLDDRLNLTLVNGRHNYCLCAK